MNHSIRRFGRVLLLSVIGLGLSWALSLPQQVHGQTVIGDFLPLTPAEVEQTPDHTTKTPAVLPPTAPPAATAPSSTQAAAPEHVLVLSRTDRKVAVYTTKGEKLASYWVALGKPGFQTPLGPFKVFSIVENPWFENPYDRSDLRPPGPDNPLGVMFIGFVREPGSRVVIGFHGTNQPNLIGQYVSHGCVRMKNSDVLALVTFVQIGTPVYVVPGTLAEEVPRLKVFSQGTP